MSREPHDPGTKKPGSFRELLFRAVVAITVFKVLSQVVYFFARYVLLVNWLTPEANQDFIVFFRTVEAVFDFTVVNSLAVTKFVASRRDQAREITRVTLVFLLLNVAVNELVVSLAFVFGAGRFNDQTVLPVVLFLVCLGATFQVFMRFFEGVLYGLKRTGAVCLVNVTLAVAFVACVVVFAWGRSAGFPGAATSFVVANAAALIVGLFFYANWSRSGRAVGDQRESDASKHGPRAKAWWPGPLRELLAFSVPIFLATAFYFLNYKFTDFFLRGFPGNLLLYFSVSSSLVVYLIGLLGIPIHESVYPFLSETLGASGGALSGENLQKFHQIYDLTLKLVSLVILGALLFLFLFVERLFGFLYPEYTDREFYSSARWICLGGFFYVLNQFYGRYALAADRSRTFLHAQLVGAVVNLLCISILVQTETYGWALAGFILSTLATFVYYARAFLQFTPLNFGDLKLPQAAGAFFSVTTAFFFLERTGVQSPAALGLLLTAYFVLLFALKVLQVGDLNLVLNFARSLVRRRTSQAQTRNK